jgi:hypothetical protein
MSPEPATGVGHVPRTRKYRQVSRLWPIRLALIYLKPLQGTVDLGDQRILINGAKPGLDGIGIPERMNLLLLEQVNVADSE